MVSVENIASLTDAELRQQLISLKVSPGPITATTRTQWEKKLASLLKKNDSSRSSEVPEEPVVKSVAQRLSATPKAQTPVKESTPQPQKRSTPQPTKLATPQPKSGTPVPKEATPAPAQEHSDEEDYEGEESMRILSDDEIAQDRLRFSRASSVTAQKPSGSIIRKLILLASVIGLGVFVYFFIENNLDVVVDQQPREEI